MGKKPLKKDKLHYQGRQLDGYNKPFNIVISEREAGKSSKVFWMLYKAFLHKHRPSIVLRRQIVDITETYIEDISKYINKWLPSEKQVELKYKKGAIKDGIIDVYIGDRIFLRIIALSVPKSRIKSLQLDDPYAIVMDEFIVDNANGEKYLTDEAGRFKELYNTYLRCATERGHKLKCYFMGNPYSVYSPILVWLGVDLTKLKPGAFIVGKQYIVECYQICEELKKKILENNPMYEFDDAYKRYAFDGMAINDQRFVIEPKQPLEYKLRFIFRISNKYLGCYWKNTNRYEKEGWHDYGKYWVSIIDYQGSKNIYAVDFNNLIAGTQLFSTQDRMSTERFRIAIQQRDVSYKSLDEAYLIEAIYKQI